MRTPMARTRGLMRLLAPSLAAIVPSSRHQVRPRSTGFIPRDSVIPQDVLKPFRFSLTIISALLLVGACVLLFPNWLTGLFSRGKEKDRKRELALAQADAKNA